MESGIDLGVGILCVIVSIYGVYALDRLGKIIGLLRDIQSQLNWIVKAKEQSGQGYDPFRGPY